MFRAAFVASCLFVAACGRPADTTVRVSVPDLNGTDTPLAGVIVTFLPYDRDEILAQLEDKAGPRPHTQELDSLFRLFRTPFAAYVRASERARTVRRLHDSLRASRGADDAEVRALADSATRIDRELAMARAAMDAIRDSVGPAITRLRAESRRWEDTTYREFRGLARRSGRGFFSRPFADTTDAEGMASMRLVGKKWWVTAQALDPVDPNGEWYWNLPITGDTLYLDSRTGRHRPRY
ncbi:MAG: hypothetical protein ACYC2K_11655 [Gemmatimonadales bacterium]